MLILHTLRQEVGLVFVILATGFAFWRGGRPERVCAVVMLTAWIVCPYLTRTGDWMDPQWSLLGVDLALLALLLWYALRGDRYWPMAAAAMHGLGLVIHFAITIDPRIHPWAYMTATGVWSYLTVLALAAGATLEGRRPLRLARRA